MRTEDGERLRTFFMRRHWLRVHLSEQRFAALKDRDWAAFGMDWFYWLAFIDGYETHAS